MKEERNRSGRRRDEREEKRGKARYEERTEMSFASINMYID